MGLGAGGDLHWVTLLSLTPAGPAWAAHSTDCSHRHAVSRDPGQTRLTLPLSAYQGKKEGAAGPGPPAGGGLGRGSQGACLPSLTGRSERGPVGAFLKRGWCIAGGYVVPY